MSCLDRVSVQQIPCIPVLRLLWLAVSMRLLGPGVWNRVSLRCPLLIVGRLLVLVSSCLWGPFLIGRRRLVQGRWLSGGRPVWPLLWHSSVSLLVGGRASGLTSGNLARL